MATKKIKTAKPKLKSVKALGPFTEENGWKRYRNKYIDPQQSDHVVVAKRVMTSVELKYARVDAGMYLSIDPDGGATGFSAETFENDFRLVEN